MITPFDRNGALDTERLAAFLEWLYAAGVDGVYLGGNTGEWCAQTLEERKRAARVAVEVSRHRGRAILHVGAVNTEDAAEIGADAISSLPPYVARWSRVEIEYYYRRLFCATKLPALRFAAGLRGLTPGCSREPTLMLTTEDQRELERNLANRGFESVPA